MCLPANRERLGRRSCCATAGGGFGLHWRARHRAVRAEHATVTALGPQLAAAAGADIEELAGVGRHRFRFRGATLRTSDDGFEDHSRSLQHVTNVGRSGRIGEHRVFKIIDRKIVSNGDTEQINNLIGIRPD